MIQHEQITKLAGAETHVFVIKAVLEGLNTVGTPLCRSFQDDNLERLMMDAATVGVNSKSIPMQLLGSEEYKVPFLGIKRTVLRVNESSHDRISKPAS